MNTKHAKDENMSAYILDENDIDKLVRWYDVLLLVYKNDQWVMKSIFGRDVHHFDPEDLESLFAQLQKAGYSRYNFEDRLNAFDDEDEETGNYRCYVLTRTADVNVIIPVPAALCSLLVSDTKE